MQSEDLNKLISLTFDENPEVRKQAAKSLGEVDDPAAIFALMELSYDKDPAVRDSAIVSLDKRKQTEAEVMSFAEIFSDKPSKPDEPQQNSAEAKAKVLRPIEKLFERHLGKERAEAVKSKMMPTIEKIYLKNLSQKSLHPKSPDEQTNNETGRKVMQEFLTNYLEVISDIDQIGSGSSSTNVPPIKPPSLDEEKDNDPSNEAPNDDEEGPAPTAEDPIVVVTPKKQQSALPKILSDVAHQIKKTVGMEQLDEVADLRSEKGLRDMPDTFFKKAYEVMMLSGGDEDVMKREMQSMIAVAEREITLAFKLARKRFKEAKVTNITKIKDGMRNITTDVLTVQSVEDITSKDEKGKPQKIRRVVVHDSSENEGIVYLFEDRGAMLNTSMKMKLIGARAKTYEGSGETVLVLGKGGNIYIVI
ncbi:MAG: HEAT repeat domain-containing protein [Candidatus Bilamarchaeum sp.]